MKDFKVLHRSNDEYGPLIVLDNKDTRILAFADNDEQSKLLKLTPHIPQHTYVQAMLLVLLFCQPKRVMILGLGGGGLIHALKHYDAGIKMTAVELREQVIVLSKRFFQLPIGKKLTLVHQDAKVFLTEKQYKKVDVVFADIYDAKGVDEMQLSAEFIALCADAIKEKGFLVLNCWKEHSQDRQLLTYLQMHFVDIRACLTGGGNWVIIACKQQDHTSASELKTYAQALSKQLDFPLDKSLTRFKPFV
ncbi:spermidine synthase [Shewanella surugensis]|uniref:Spermidine synthase n=1 Tax=Shewanella surugensis TaxID=212020 RepID=A0ABT0L6N6_9GAMM|nr:spermidine synthase [Shewanella surugensis]MCL1123343.1 spermidine synthase [Shewanella surugensis]